jgi:hypothetical protein
LRDYLDACSIPNTIIRGAEFEQLSAFLGRLRRG